MDPLDEHSLTQVQMERINHIFELHCNHMHRGLSQAAPLPERND